MSFAIIEPRDMYICSLLMYHKLLNREQFDLLQRAVAATPGLSVADVLVEAGLITFQQRQAIENLLHASSAVGEMIHGKIPPSRLGAMIMVSDTSRGEDEAPAGIDRAMAATRIYTDPELEGGVPKSPDRERTQSLANEETQRQMSRSVPDQLGSPLAPVTPRFTHRPFATPDELASKAIPTGEMMIVSDDTVADKSAATMPGLPRDMAATIVEAARDLQATMILKKLGAGEGEEIGDESERTMTATPGMRAEAALEEMAELRMSGRTGDTGKQAKLESEAVKTGITPDLDQTEVSVGMEDAKTQPSVFGGSMSRSMNSMMAASLFVSQSQEVDLLSEVRSGRLNVSSVLTDDELKLATEKASKIRGSIIGKKIGGYVVLDKLGAGGQGEVFLAKQLSLNRYVALKVLPSEYAYDQEWVQRFLREATLLAKVAHPNVVQVYDVGQAGEKFYITMENVDGESLKDLIKRERQVPIPVAVSLIKQCCRALGRVKKEGIAHRDIKPGNILVTKAGEAKVLDFGLAEYAKELREKDSGHAAGTPYYMPPEAIKNQPATHLSDQYSLGATLYHLLAGKPPFEANSLAELTSLHLEGPIPRASDVNPAVPKELDDVIIRMMAKNISDRFHSFRDVFEALESVELNMGIKTSREGFLSEGLLRLNAVNIRNLKLNIVWWTFVSVVFCHIGIGLNLLIKQGFDGGDAAYWIARTGSWGTYLVLTAYAMILYVGMVRKRWLPALGSLRGWIKAHIAVALTGTFLVMVHSGHFLRDYISLPLEARAGVKPVAFLPLLSSLALMIVVASGLVGRYIYRDLQQQAALDRIATAGADEDEDKPTASRVALIIISQKAMGWWRLVHYPITVVWLILTIAHVATILYFGGPLLPKHPDANWFPAQVAASPAADNPS